MGAVANGTHESHGSVAGNGVRRHGTARHPTRGIPDHPRRERGSQRALLRRLPHRDPPTPTAGSPTTPDRSTHPVVTVKPSMVDRLVMQLLSPRTTNGPTHVGTAGR